MQYWIGLCGDLGISPEELVAAWNGDRECRIVAEARLHLGSGVAHGSGEVLPSEPIVVLESEAPGVSVEDVCRLIRGVLARHGVRRRVYVEEQLRHGDVGLLTVSLDPYWHD